MLIYTLSMNYNDYRLYQKLPNADQHSSITSIYEPIAIHVFSGIRVLPKMVLRPTGFCLCQYACISAL